MVGAGGVALEVKLEKDNLGDHKQMAGPMDRDFRHPRGADAHDC